jgi:hypothetical protein
MGRQLQAAAALTYGRNILALHVNSTYSKIHFIPLTKCNQCRGQENVGLYIHSPTRLHGVVLD